MQFGVVVPMSTTVPTPRRRSTLSRFVLKNAEKRGFTTTRSPGCGASGAGSSSERGFTHARDTGLPPSCHAAWRTASTSEPSSAYSRTTWNTGMPSSRAWSSAREHAGTVAAAPSTHRADAGSMNPFCMSMTMRAALRGSIIACSLPRARTRSCGSL